MSKNLPPTTTNLYSVMVSLMLKPIEIQSSFNLTMKDLRMGCDPRVDLYSLAVVDKRRPGEVRKKVSWLFLEIISFFNTKPNQI